MFKRLSRLLPVAMVLLCSACFSMPQTAEEFRQAVPGSFSGTHKGYEVDRSYRKIGATLRRRAKECLNVSVEVSSVGYGSASHWIDVYTPTVIVGKQRTELHLQQHKKQANLIKPHKEPEGGYYLLVVDVDKLSPKRVRVDMYAPRMGYDHLVEAVDGWIRGTSQLCPDMAEHDL